MSTAMSTGISLTALLNTMGVEDVTTDVSKTDVIISSSKTTMTTAMTEKPYEEFTEVKVAVMIDRIYIPTLVALGLLGNGLSFVTLVCSSLRNTSTCVYMAAIAIFDAVVLILDLCVLIRGYLGYTEFYFRNDWACGFHNFLFYFSIHAGVIILVAMTVDRYVVVRFPLKAQSICTPKSAIIVIACICLFSFALNFQIMFTRKMAAVGDAVDPLKCVYTDPNVDFFMKKIYTWIDASIYSFIPFLSLLVLNVLIVRQLSLSRKFSRQFTQSPGGRKGKGGNVRVQMAEGDSSMNSDAYTANTELSRNSDNTDVDGNVTKVTPTISEKVATNGTSTSHSKSSNRSKSMSNTNITSMLLMVSFTFLLLTSPVVIVLLYQRYYWLPTTNQELAKARLLHAFVDNIMYTNHAVNFLLYCLSGRRFRDEFKRLLYCMCCRI